MLPIKPRGRKPQPVERQNLHKASRRQTQREMAKLLRPQKGGGRQPYNEAEQGVGEKSGENFHKARIAGVSMI